MCTRELKKSTRKIEKKWARGNTSQFQKKTKVYRVEMSSLIKAPLYYLLTMSEVIAIIFKKNFSKKLSEENQLMTQAQPEPQL